MPTSLPDQFALKFVYAAHDRHHQSVELARSVAPDFREREKAAILLLKFVQYVVQVPRRSRQSIKLAHHDGIAGN